MKAEKIYRKIEQMEAVEGRTIRGLACVTGAWSKDLGGFREMIRPEALTEDLIKRSDVQLNVDHDPKSVLARSRFGAGSLKLTLTGRGLEFETEAPRTSLGEDMLEMLKRGDYSQCSFCFSLPEKDADEWYQKDGQLCREIKNFDRLWDVSIVYDPAYDQTFVDARSMDKVKIMQHLQELENEINNIYHEEESN